MFCTRCGASIAAGAAFCSSCGTQAGAAPVVVQAPAVAPSPSGFAIASLACGVAGFWVLPLLGSILAIVFAAKADREIDASGGALTGKDMAKAGRILGIVGCSIAGLVGAALLIAIVAAVRHVPG